MRKRHIIDPDLRPLTDAEREYVKKLGNPYAPLSIGLIVKQVKGLLISARAFEKECTRILRQYIPSAENGRLRPHHLAFIERNRVKSPSFRLRILELLREYDLSITLGLQAQFNRERTEFTNDKLLRIEQDANKAENT